MESYIHIHPDFQAGTRAGQPFRVIEPSGSTMAIIEALDAKARRG